VLLTTHPPSSASVMEE